MVTRLTNAGLNYVRPTTDVARDPLAPNPQLVATLAVESSTGTPGEYLITLPRAYRNIKKLTVAETITPNNLNARRIRIDRLSGEPLFATSCYGSDGTTVHTGEIVVLPGKKDYEVAVWRDATGQIDQQMRLTQSMWDPTTAFTSQIIVVLLIECATWD